MADTRELANKARTTLSQALAALQSGDDVPESLLEIAAPIARTMGILHRIESSGTGDGAQVEQALENVRGALDALQSVGVEHPAVSQTMEAVAGSLSKLFALAKALKSEPAPAKEPPRAEPTAPAVRPRPAPEPAPQPRWEPEPAPQPRWEPEPAPQPRWEPEPPPPDRQQAQYAPTEELARPHLGVPERVPGTSEAPLPLQDARRIDVELGAHSGSNFYKGLSGNDVIDHGGIFVATYNVVPVGTPVALRVHLPGDLDFEGDAVVQWTRDTRGGESEPGFGARFTRISPEGRQLVYRYVRNREPIFYDDM
jgi:hypothetical protein